MYRMNYNNCSSPRDRLDESLLTRVAEQRRSSCRGNNQARNIERGCGCNQASEAYERENSCSCEHDNYNNDEFDYSLAMVYSPHQEWQNIYCEEEGLAAGTIFKELDKPFYGPKCHGGNCYE